MPYFLAIQSTYTAIECALLCNTTLLEQIVIDKMAVSSSLIIELQNLLTRHQQSLSTLSFAIVNRGPAPFTTLRVMIATMNGLQYAHRLPLIGVNCFDAWFHGLAIHKTDSAILMNAFNREVYMAFKKAESSTYTASCIPAESAIQELASSDSKKIIIVGNGAVMYQEMLERALPQKLIYGGDPQHSMNTIQDLAALGLKQWQTDPGKQAPIMPFYLKSLMPMSR